MRSVAKRGEIAGESPDALGVLRGERSRGEESFAGAAKIQRDIEELFELLFCEVNPIPVKKAVDLMGFNAGPLRMPLTEMTPANTEKLRQAMKDFGIL